MNPGSAALTLRGFSLAYRLRTGELLPVFDGVDLELPAGGFYLVVGPSGAGKSTLIRLVTGLWDARELAPRIRGQALVLGARAGVHGHRLSGRVTAVMQDEGLLDELTPKENVQLALRAAGRSPKLALALLAQAGMPDPPEDVHALSGGMRKRVAVARALGGDPELWVLDEPTAGLDPDAQREIAALLRGTHDAALGRRTTLVVTHDIEAFLAHADGLIELRPDRLGIELTAADGYLGNRGGSASPSRTARDLEDELPGVASLRALVLEAAAAAHTLGEACVRLPPVYPTLVARTTARYLVEPVAYACLGSGVIGGLATFFALRNNPLEGAFTSQVLTGAGKVLMAVLIPLLVGFFFTARMAAGAAARVGTMKRTNQIAALRLMGVRPADYLLTPLLWAMMLSLPVVTAAGLVCAALASLLAARLVMGISSYGWAVAFFHTVDSRDLLFGVLKTTVSGFLVAVLTYHLGTAPKRSGRDVGSAVNGAIVGGTVVILMVHALLTLLQFP